MKQVAMFVLIVLFLLGTWHLAEAVEPLMLYENFEMGPLSPDRWNGASFGTGGPLQSQNLYEGNRTIIMDPSGVGRNLRILSRSYGKTDSDIGATLGSYGLAFKNPATVTAIRAKVKVLSVVSKGCPLNADPTFAQAQLLGFFFNTGVTPATDPQDATNDVLVIVGVRRVSTSADPANVLDVFAFVARCDDHDCINISFLGPGWFVPLGKANVGQWVRLLVQWDQVNNQFIFQRDSRAPQFVSYLGVVTETGPAHLNNKLIAVNNFVPNCTGVPRPFGSVNALFDSVFVNQSPIP